MASTALQIGDKAPLLRHLITLPIPNGLGANRVRNTLSDVQEVHTEPQFIAG